MVGGVEARPRPEAHRRALTATSVVLGLSIAVGVVLRLVGLGHAQLTFDETFSAVAARMPFDQFFGFLRHHDAHPPLDYLLRRPAALAGGSEAALRLPSALLSIGALVLFAVWMRGKGRAGLIATAFMAVSAFQLTYGREARMYAGMTLVGVAAAFAADRWLHAEEAGGRTRSKLCVAVGIAVLVGLFFHASALVLAAGLFLVPGLRRDRDAWQWRAAIVAPFAVWAVLWGPSFIDQAHAASSSWIPFTTTNGLAGTVNELVTSYGFTRWAVIGLVVAGCVLLARADSRSGRLMVCCFAVPVVVAAVIGLRAHFLLPRTLAFASWAPLFAIAAVVDSIFRRSRMIGIAALAGAAVLLLPSTVAAVQSKPPESAAVLDEVGRVARDGDAVAVHPSWLRPLTRWYYGVQRPGPEHALHADRLDVDGLVLGDRPWNGRVWVVEPVSYRVPTAGMESCAPEVTKGTYRLLCLSTRSPA